MVSNWFADWFADWFANRFIDDFWIDSTIDLQIDLPIDALMALNLYLWSVSRYFLEIIIRAITVMIDYHFDHRNWIFIFAVLSLEIPSRQMSAPPLPSAARSEKDRHPEVRKNSRFEGCGYLLKIYCFNRTSSYVVWCVSMQHSVSSFV